MIKRIGVVLSSGLLKLSLFLLAVIGGILFAFNNPATVKQALRDSGLYGSVVDSVLKTTAQEAQQQGENLPLDDLAVQKAVKEALPAEFLQANSEHVIDGMYAWINGETAQPEFSVDLSGAKAQIIDGVARAAQTRYESLPVCTLQQLQTIDRSANPFEIPCQIPGTTGANLADRARLEMQNNQNFLKDPVITADTLLKNDQGRDITKDLEAVPDGFKFVKLLPTTLGIISALLALAVIFLSETRHIGLRRLGITFIGTGLFLLVGSLITRAMFGQANQPGRLVQEDNEYNANIVQGLHSIFDALNEGLMRYYVPYILIGVGILATLWYQNRMSKATPIGEVNSSPNTKPKTK